MAVTFQGINPTGVASFQASAAISANTRVKISSTRTVSASGSGEEWHGVALDNLSSADATLGKNVAVQLRSAPGTLRMVAAGAITCGAYVYSAASGKVDDTHNGDPIGIALNDCASDGDPVEVEPIRARLLEATYEFTGTPAATDQVFFVAPCPCKILAISEVHSTAAGGASKIQVTKDTSTDAPGAGTDLLTNNTNTGFDLNGTANTVQTGTLTTTSGATTLAAGDRLSVDFANTIQSTAGATITVILIAL